MKKKEEKNGPRGRQGGHYPAGPYLLGSSDEQIEYLLKTTSWAKNWLNAGYFNTEKPQQQIELPDFAIGKYPVTVGQYQAFMQAGGYRSSVDATREPNLLPWLDDERLPIVGVNWYEATAYCAWLSEATGRI